MNEKYDVIIGLEIHAELKTKSKMFCSCDNDAHGKEPNTTVCPVCMGHPGTLPVPNRQAIEWTILVGLGLDCLVNQLSKFDRKNYFYPDLPKGYQISQYDLPLVYNGSLDLDGESIAITRIHLEEDTGKLAHPTGKSYTLIDFNRSSTPLMELVTEPVIKDAATAKKFCQRYQQILRYLDVSNADMEKGEMRCEANISVQEKGKWVYQGNCRIEPLGDYKLNPKVELKNINSFRAMEKAVEYEIKRQVQALADGEKLVQETRGWNDDKGITYSQRIKESSAEYRYFPEPDIPPLHFSSEEIEKIKAQLIEMPHKKKNRFMSEYGFDNATAETLVADKKVAAYAEEVISELRAWIDSMGDNWEKHSSKLSKLTANWLVGELFKHLNENNQTIADIKVTPENFAQLIALVFENKINSSAAQTILHDMYISGGDATQIMKDLGLEQLDNRDELKNIIQELITKNPTQTQQYRDGKTNVLQFFVGQAMAATKGKANPKIVMELLQELLK